MRNVVLLHDRVFLLPSDCYVDSGSGIAAHVVSLCINESIDGSTAYFLLNTGTLLSFHASHCLYRFNQAWNLNVTEDLEPNSDWFDVTYVAMIGCVVCISYSGSIISIDEEDTSCVELIGVIDGGISTAKWSPDQSCLNIVTNNNTIIRCKEQVM